MKYPFFLSLFLSLSSSALSAHLLLDYIMVIYLDIADLKGNMEEVLLCVVNSYTMA